MNKFLLLVLLISFVAADQLPANLSLENGEVLKVDGYVNAWAGASNEYVLILRYESDSLEDKVFLRDRAELIWKTYRPLVESKGFEYAGIKAIKYDGPKTTLGKRTFKAYTHVLFKNEDGNWEFYPSNN
jgi:hypothetical protein